MCRYRYCRDTLQAHLTSMDGGNAKFSMELNWPWKLGHDKQLPCLKASSASMPLVRELDNFVTSHQNMDGHDRIYTRLDKRHSRHLELWLKP
ncbi:hypothetical protein ACVBKF_02700 [Shewanella sp. 0m-11]